MYRSVARLSLENLIQLGVCDDRFRLRDRKVDALNRHFLALSRVGRIAATTLLLGIVLVTCGSLFDSAMASEMNVLSNSDSGQSDATGNWFINRFHLQVNVGLGDYEDLSKVREFVDSSLLTDNGQNFHTSATLRLFHGAVGVELGAYETWRRGTDVKVEPEGLTNDTFLRSGHILAKFHAELLGRRMFLEPGFGVGVIEERLKIRVGNSTRQKERYFGRGLIYGIEGKVRVIPGINLRSSYLRRSYSVSDHVFTAWLELSTDIDPNIPRNHRERLGAMFFALGYRTRWVEDGRIDKLILLTVGLSGELPFRDVPSK